MIMFECRGPFQWRASTTRFANFTRWMWGWFAITTCPYDLNELIEGIGRAGVEVYGKDHK